MKYNSCSFVASGAVDELQQLHVIIAHFLAYFSYLRNLNQDFFQDFFFLTQLLRYRIEFLLVNGVLIFVNHLCKWPFEQIASLLYILLQSLNCVGVIAKRALVTHLCNSRWKNASQHQQYIRVIAHWVAKAVYW